jgi:DNA polymerase III epsilon subunit-like protein
MSAKRELFISVDVETSGPIPGEYSLLTIGACCVDDDTRTFSAALKPISDKADPKALAVTGLSLENLQVRGDEPIVAMRSFSDWVTTVSGNDTEPVFVGLNAPFDWSFVNYYFHHFIGENPFGFAALDIKSYYMGAASTSWKDTKASRLQQALRPVTRPDHDAVHDAIYQAELFRLIRDLKRP